MNILFSPQNTGACPICKKRPECRILKTMNESVKTIAPCNNEPLEVVVYTCEYFEEN